MTPAMFVSSRMASASCPTCFSSAPDFCSDCGSVLPSPGVQDTVICGVCGHCTEVSVFLEKCIQRTVVFNHLHSITGGQDESEDAAAIKGPLIDRRCSRCGYEKMAYHTRQMRSADEGQTVFYTCVQCR
ncbi:hypothetical protein GDO81_009935 [Engystomops pustulosus]|nr:hypothetical protein GDO81_009935 [Engystomops pustulosus]